MADPRFFDNRGPFKAADLCGWIGAALPDGVDRDASIEDLASLEGAGPSHLTFWAGAKSARAAVSASGAGFCLMPEGLDAPEMPSAMVRLAVADPVAAFAEVARRFYPDHELGSWNQQTAVDSSAIIGEDVTLAPGVVIGPGAEIGAGTRIGPGSVIGRGVCIGRDCEIGAHVSISHAYLGDSLLIQPGVRIGQPGYGFVSGASGHRKIPQLGRAIVQDRVEFGANSAVDRGALGDTVIGEGTKIDNLVHIGHNCRVGRHCLITGQVGLAGSVELGDFVVFGGQTGVADHTRIGDGARFAGKSGVPSGEYAGGQDYGGFPVRPVKDWRREVAALALLAKRRKRDKQ